jgi:predicted amidohydrolase YtcJ
MFAAWGEEARRAIPVASMLRAGVVVGGGSDAFPCEPLFGAHLAVTRALGDGSHLSLDQRLAPEEALGLFTRGAGA